MSQTRLIIKQMSKQEFFISIAYISMRRKLSSRALASEQTDRPAAAIGVRRPDDLVEVLEDEKELCQLVEDVETVPQLCPVPMEHTVAEAMDRRDSQFREVARVADFQGGGGQAIAHLEGGLLGECAEHELSGLGFLQQ